MKYVNRADRDGWYTRFDAATGAFCQLDGKFSEYTIKYPYQAASSSTVSRGIENKEFRATGRSIKGIENGSYLESELSLSGINYKFAINTITITAILLSFETCAIQLQTF